MKKALFYTLIVFPFRLIAQTFTVEGTVITDNDLKPIPFANIQDKTSRLGTQADSLGRFSLVLPQKKIKLSASSVGYIPKTITLNSENYIVFRLSPVPTLNEITVRPSENPAEVLFRKVWKNADKNRPENIPQFKSEIYSKFKLDLTRLDSANKQSAEPLKNFPIAIIENQGTLFQKNKIRKEIIEHSISTFPKHFPANLMINPEVNPFSFYDKEIQINLNNMTAMGGSSDLNNIRFYHNPINPKVFSVYDLEITDTLFTSTDSIFVVNFWSKNKKNQNALSGKIKINARDFAIIGVETQNADSAQIASFKIKQTYHKISEKWIPENRYFELRYKLNSPKYKGFIYYFSEIWLYNFSLDFKPNEVVFDGSTRQILPKADTTSNQYFDKIRPLILTEKEKSFYDLAEKKLNKSVVKKLIEPGMKISVPLMQGGLAVGKFYLLTNQFSTNQHEWIRLGLGVQNNQINNPRWRILTSAGYGIRDKTFKYNFTTAYHITRDRYNKIEAFYTREIQRPGQNPTLFPNTLTPGYIALNIGLEKYWLDNYQKAGAGIFFKPFKYTQIRIFDEYEIRTPINYKVNDYDSNRFEYNIAGLSLRFAYKEKINRIGYLETIINQNFPILRINYGRYFPQNRQLNQFSKANLVVIQQIKTKRIGKSQLNLSAGESWGVLPFPYMFNNLATPLNIFSSGSSDGFSGLSIQGMGYNRYLSAGWVHDFENKILKTNSRWFRPQFAIGQKIGWTQLTQNTPIIDSEPISEIKSSILESRLQVRNLIVFGLFGFKIGLGVNASATYFGQKNTDVIFRIRPSINSVPF